MSIRQFTPGNTFSLFFDFRDSVGVRTSVDSPKVNIFDVYRNKYIENDDLDTTATVGRFQYDFFVPLGATIGTWFGLATGITASSTIFSNSYPFEVIDFKQEPFWVSLDEFREYLGADDDDHTEDSKLRQILQASIELVEKFTGRHFGISEYTETYEIQNTDRIKLKKYPVVEVLDLDATWKITPRDLTNLHFETISGAATNFFWRLDGPNGILYLTDSAGFSCTYDDTLVVVRYMAGYAIIPEPVRTAVLQLGVALNSLVCTAGTDMVRLADISYQPVKNLLETRDGYTAIGEMLIRFQNKAQV